MFFRTFTWRLLYVYKTFGCFVFSVFSLKLNDYQGSYTNATGRVTLSHFHTSILSLWVFNVGQSLTRTRWSYSTGLQYRWQPLHTAFVKYLGCLFSFSSSSKVHLQLKRDPIWFTLLLWRGGIFKLSRRSWYEFLFTNNQPAFDTFSTTLRGVTCFSPQGADWIVWTM